MKYLLDTHTIIWLAMDDSRLSKRVKKLFLEESNDIFVSVATLWEMAIKISIGKLVLPASLSKFVTQEIRDNAVNILSIKPNHTFRLSKLPFHHRDPFDRLIICQAQQDELAIVSKDINFAKYDVDLIWK